MNASGIKIETDRLLLREYNVSDWQAVHEYAQQEDILIYEAWGPNTEQDTQFFINTCLEEQDQSQRTVFNLVIILKDINKLIGAVRFAFFSGDWERAETGYIINPTYWRNGYATEATGAMINYFETMFPVATVTATCDVLNIASQKVLEKCGFTQKCIVEKGTPLKGRLRDSYAYEKLIK